MVLIRMAPGLEFDRLGPTTFHFAGVLRSPKNSRRKEKEPLHFPNRFN